MTIKDHFTRITRASSRSSEVHEATRSRVTSQVIVLTVFLTCATFIQGLLSRGFGLTLNCMVNVTTADNPVSRDNDSASLNICPNVGNTDLQEPSRNQLTGYHGTYNWDSIQQANLIAMYSWGAIVSLPFSGFLIAATNPKQVVALALFVIGMSMGLFPVITKRFDYAGAMVIRLIMGVAFSLISPAMDQVIATSTPWHFRNFLYAIISTGSFVSAIVGNSIGGVLCSGSILGGWPAIFYIAAMLAGIWLICWEIYLLTQKIMEDRLRTVPYDPITPLKFGAKRSVRARLNMEYLRQFWNQLGKRPALWAMLPSVMAATWTNSLFMNFIPTFYRDTLRISLKTNGVISALPFLAIVIFSNVFSALADSLRNRTISRYYRRITGKRAGPSPDVVSKYFNTFGFVSSGLIIALTTLIPCLSQVTAVSLLTLGSALYTAVFPGYRVGIVSLAPHWASVISSITSLSSMIAGLIFPYIEGGVVRHGLLSEWRILFMCIVAIDIVAAIVYAVFGSVTEKQSDSISSATSVSPIDPANVDTEETPLIQD